MNTTTSGNQNTAGSYIRPHANGVYLHVKVQPRASSNEIGQPIGGELKIKVSAPPVDAAANEALLRLLAQRLGCPRGAVQLVRGQTSRHKVIFIHGLGADVVEERLRS
jgi:uncharacterized protein (TIGR00251 family)